MTPFIATPDQIAEFQAEADSWLATPYVANGAVKGSGCSCSALPWAILHACGHPAPPAPDRRGLMKVELLPAMVNWLEARPELYAKVQLEDIAPGDVAILDAGIGHMLIVRDRENFIQSWPNRGAHKTSTQDQAIRRRIIGIWRPLAQVTSPLP